MRNATYSEVPAEIKELWGEAQAAEDRGDYAASNAAQEESEKLWKAWLRGRAAARGAS